MHMLGCVQPSASCCTCVRRREERGRAQERNRQQPPPTETAWCLCAHCIPATDTMPVDAMTSLCYNSAHSPSCTCICMVVHRCGCWRHAGPGPMVHPLERSVARDRVLFELDRGQTAIQRNREGRRCRVVWTRAGGTRDQWFPRFRESIGRSQIRLGGTFACACGPIPAASATRGVRVSRWSQRACAATATPPPSNACLSATLFEFSPMIEQPVCLSIMKQSSDSACGGYTHA